MECEEKSLNQIWRESGKPAPFKEFANWYNNSKIVAENNAENIIHNNQVESLSNPLEIKLDEANVISEIGHGDNVWVAVAVGVAVVAGIYLLIYKKEE